MADRIFQRLQTFARALAPVGMGLLHSYFGSYPPVFWALILAAAGATLSILVAKKP